MKISLFEVKVNDSPVAVTEAGFGIMLFFERSVGTETLPVQPDIITAAIAARMGDCNFIGLLY